MNCRERFLQLANHFDDVPGGLAVVGRAVASVRKAKRDYGPVQMGVSIPQTRRIHSLLVSVLESMRDRELDLGWDMVVVEAGELLQKKIEESRLRIPTRRARIRLARLLDPVVQFELLVEAAELAQAKAVKHYSGRPKDDRLAGASYNAVRAYTCLSMLSGKVLSDAFPSVANGGWRWCETAVDIYASDLGRAQSTMSKSVRRSGSEYRKFIVRVFPNRDFEKITWNTIAGNLLLEQFFGVEWSDLIPISEPPVIGDTNSRREQRDRVWAKLGDPDPADYLRHVLNPDENP